MSPVSKSSSMVCSCDVCSSTNHKNSKKISVIVLSGLIRRGAQQPEAERPITLVTYLRSIYCRSEVFLHTRCACIIGQYCTTIVPCDVSPVLEHVMSQKQEIQEHFFVFMLNRSIYGVFPVGERNTVHFHRGASETFYHDDRLPAPCSTNQSYSLVISGEIL